MLFVSRCISCDRWLLMRCKKVHKKYSCSKCIPKNSAARNDIEESYDYEWKFLSK